MEFFEFPLSFFIPAISAFIEKVDGLKSSNSIRKYLIVSSAYFIRVFGFLEISIGLFISKCNAFAIFAPVPVGFVQDD